MQLNPCKDIDPMLQVTVPILVKRIVEYMILFEVSEGKEIEALEKMKAGIEVSKNYIRECRGSNKLYELLNWTAPPEK